MSAPQLRPGGRATVHYRFQRASEAPITDCFAANDTMGLRV
jgi:hypothetical protein